MLGLSADKILMIALVAGLLLGPETLPKAASHLATAIRKLRTFADESSARVRSEAGTSFEDVDWKKLDPRLYDPRRIIRDALLEEPIQPNRNISTRELSTGQVPPSRPPAELLAPRQIDEA